MGIHLLMPTASDPSLKAMARYAHIVGCDRMPWFSKASVHNGILSLHRESNEGGSVRIPWRVDDFGEVVLPTGCLMQRELPYMLEVELARGQVTQIRNQLGEWELAGWIPSLELQERNTCVVRLLREAIIAEEAEKKREKAVSCLRFALDLAEELCLARAAHSLQTQSRPLLQQRLGCVLGANVTETEHVQKLSSFFGHLVLPIAWADLEQTQGNYSWERLDAQVEACADANVSFSVGPIVDFHGRQLPGWLNRWRENPRTFSTLLVDFVETCVSRYQGRVSQWATTIGANCMALRGLSEEQHLWLTRQLFEAAQDADPYAKFTLGVRQPWGEYLLQEERAYCPFGFVDALLRLDLPLHGLDLEIAMGYPDSGSFCRTLLDYSQLLDHYARLSVPLNVSLYFPSGVVARPSESAYAGSWRGVPTEESQAAWAEAAVSIALSKPAVDRVIWGSARDMPGDLFPLAGLADQEGRKKQSPERLATILQRAPQPGSGF